MQNVPKLKSLGCIYVFDKNISDRVRVTPNIFAWGT